MCSLISLSLRLPYLVSLPLGLTYLRFSCHLGYHTWVGTSSQTNAVMIHMCTLCHEIYRNEWFWPNWLSPHHLILHTVIYQSLTHSDLRLSRTSQWSPQLPQTLAHFTANTYLNRICAGIRHWLTSSYVRLVFIGLGLAFRMSLFDRIPQRCVNFSSTWIIWTGKSEESRSCSPILSVEHLSVVFMACTQTRKTSVLA